ncbi:hypothetical protein BJ138DRAFT_72092 [Hygrophoropsis aurantiaca]|uniref:Uncharacterized protein n=1 Tax=Hygrophoropsis aurantiaca TaxID=72124 RepID=A0ACB8ABS4_9AGAM|nr:hypothetical protein BJ138DRAFT_72092 [Hygrophoropsis aurantiaca]
MQAPHDIAQHNDLPPLEMNQISMDKQGRFMSQCYCGKWNQRNTETNWYTIWNIVLGEIFHRIPAAGVAPQRALQLTRDEMLRRLAAQDNEEAENLSDASTVTIPAKKAYGRLPDFAIALAIGSACPQHALHNVFHVDHEFGDVTPVLVEIKPYISRRTPVDSREFEEELALEFFDAAGDVYIQALCAFLWYPVLQKVIVIIASGPWWTFAEVSRTNQQVDRDLRQFVKKPAKDESSKISCAHIEFRQDHGPLDINDVRWRILHKEVQTMVEDLETRLAARLQNQ